MKKTKNFGVTIAGIVILALAVLLIFLTIFVPFSRENKILRERAELLLYAEYERMMLFDPLWESENAIQGRGREVMLIKEEADALREKFAEVVAKGFRNRENVCMTEGAWDIKWQIRTANGTICDLYFAKDMLYFYAEGTAFFFEPKDLIAYDAFFVLLQSMLKS